MPLAAAVLAALGAHVSIDIVGDYVLPHDTFDDPSHGSRSIASIVLAVTMLGALAVVVRAAFSDVRGRRGALDGVLGAAVPASALRFALVVAASALPILAAMAWLDNSSAGIEIDGIADLFGGSVPLGAGIDVAFAFVCATAFHSLARILSRHRRSIVRIVAACTRIARGTNRTLVSSISMARSDRPRVAAALVRCTGAMRAPPALLPELPLA